MKIHLPTYLRIMILTCIKYDHAAVLNIDCVKYGHSAVLNMELQSQHRASVPQMVLGISEIGLEL